MKSFMHRNFNEKWYLNDILEFSRRNFGQFLFEATDFTMQMNMLNVICSYYHGEHLKEFDLLVKSYKAILLLRGSGTFSDDVKNELVDILRTNAAIQFKDKQQILNLINGCVWPQAIISMPIDSLTPKALNNKMRKVNWHDVQIRIGSFFSFLPDLLFWWIKNEISITKGQSRLDAIE